MRLSNKFSAILLTTAFTLGFALPSSSKAANIPCANITNDLSYGMKDLSGNAPILALQNFLFSKGYLSATPNGNFGPATFSATIAFQTANNISPTGRVGPITRAAIYSASCPVSSNSTPQTSPATSPSNSNVTAPMTGATLSLGQTYTIAWKGADNAGYDIVLEDKNGLSQGFITPNTMVSGSYSWQVGKVLSAATNSYLTVLPGTYQIHLYNISGGAADIWSGVFTVVAPPLTLQEIIPATVSYKSVNPTVVLYGSGLNSSVRISVDGYYNYSGTILYVSLDGTVAVFSMPSGVAPGQHNVIVSNNYDSMASEPINVIQ